MRRLLDLFLFGVVTALITPVTSNLVKAAPFNGGQQITITARVPLSPTHQALINKYSTISLSKPLGNPDWLLQVHLRGLGRKAQTNHQLVYRTLNKEQQIASEVLLTTDSHGRASLPLNFCQPAQLSAITINDRSFGGDFMLSKIELGLWQHTCYDPPLVGTIKSRKLSSIAFANEGQKINLAARFTSSYAGSSHAGSFLARSPD